VRKSALFAFGLVVTIIVALGLVVLSSASEANAIRISLRLARIANPTATPVPNPYYFMERQFAYLIIGIVVATVTAAFDYRKWRDCPWLTFLAYAAVVAGLAAVFFYKDINGSHRWFKLGPVLVQPSEFAKIATVFVTAVLLDRASWRVEEFKSGLLWPSLFVAGLAGLVLAEPDFGSVMVIGGAGILVMFVAGVRIRHMLPFFLAGLALVGFLVFHNENRMARIKAFLNTQTEEKGKVVVLDEATKRATHQVKHSLIAIRNGGVWGVGLGESMQKQYYLPEAHTDFIFAIGAEELGLPFTIGVIALFHTFFALCVYIALKATDRFGRFLVIGMGFIIFFQAMFNLGVVSGALPTKGMALPFFSYGGSNMVCAFISVGTILSVGIRSWMEYERGHSRKFVTTR